MESIVLPEMVRMQTNKSEDIWHVGRVQERQAAWQTRG